MVCSKQACLSGGRWKGEHPTEVGVSPRGLGMCRWCQEQVCSECFVPNGICSQCDDFREKWGGKDCTNYKELLRRIKKGKAKDALIKQKAQERQKEAENNGMKKAMKNCLRKLWRLLQKK